MILSQKLISQESFILDPHPHKIGPNWNTIKWAVVKGLYRLDQKNKFFYFGSLEGRIGHYKVVWTYFNIFHISTISLSLLMASGWGHRNPSSSLLLITLPFSFYSLHFYDLGIIWCRNELCMYNKQFCCSNPSDLNQGIEYLMKFQKIQNFSFRGQTFAQFSQLVSTNDDYECNWNVFPSSKQYLSLSYGPKM